jgi:16S rRNA processing protein RimM
VQFDGLSDRAAAEGLKGIDLFVPRERLPAPDEDEYYHADLIGLDAISSDGKSIGKVVGVENYGAGDLIEIAREKGSTVLIPFTRANVPKIELTAGRLVVDPPPGLLD